MDALFTAGGDQPVGPAVIGLRGIRGAGAAIGQFPPEPGGFLCQGLFTTGLAPVRQAVPKTGGPEPRRRRQQAKEERAENGGIDRHHGFKGQGPEFKRQWLVIGCGKGAGNSQERDRQYPKDDAH